MRVLFTCAVLTLIASLGTAAHADGPTRVKLRSRGLQVELPPGWKLDPDAGEWVLGDDVLVPANGDVSPTIEVLEGYYGCDKILADFSLSTPLEPRLALIPAAYHPKIAYLDKGPGMQVVNTCLDAEGERLLLVRLRFLPEDDPARITAVLDAIARAYESTLGPPVTTAVSSTTIPRPDIKFLPGTGLLLTVPPAWSTHQTASGNLAGDIFASGGESVLLAHSAEARSCDEIIRMFERTKKTRAEARSAFAPGAFDPRMVRSPAQRVEHFSFCQKGKSPGAYLINAIVPSGAAPSSSLIALLQEIARAVESGPPGADRGPVVRKAQRLEGTRLLVTLPSGWSASPHVERGFRSDVLRGPRDSKESVLLGWLDQKADCAAVIRHYESAYKSRARPRPAFAPSSFHDRVVVATAEGADRYVFCRRKGLGVYVLDVEVPSGTVGSPELVEMLHSIADAITPPRVTTGSTRTNVAGTRASYDTSWRRPRAKPSANTLVLEARAGILEPTVDTLTSSYAITGGISRLNLGTSDGFSLATELIAIGGYAGNAGLMIDARAGIGGAFSIGTRSRFGVLLGAGADGLGLGEDENDPAKVILPFRGSFYASAVLRTELTDRMGLQLLGTYRDRSAETGLVGEARLQMVGGSRPWSIVAFYADLDVATLLGGGIAFGL